MLKFNISRILKEKGIERPYSYFISKGYQRDKAQRLGKDTLKTINLQTLEHLCVLFDCTPNELLEWKPGKEVQDVSTHPLRDLQRSDSPVNIKALLHAIPVTQLPEIEKLIKERIRK